MAEGEAIQMEGEIMAEERSDRLRHGLERVLVGANLAVNSLAVSGVAPAAVSLLLQRVIDAGEVYLRGDEAMTDVLKWWKAHNESGEPMTVELVRDKFKRAADAHAGVQSYRERYGLETVDAE